MTNSVIDTISHNPLPLCVDLDGTLIQTDSLWESCLCLIGQHPFISLLMPFWLLLGKVGFKNKVSQYAELNPESLPFNVDILKYITHQKLQNRHLVLVTASTKKIADAIATHLKIFDEVIASDKNTNLSGENKAKVLVDKFGEKGFVYAGNANIDLNVWKHSAAAIVVNAPNALHQKAKEISPIENVFPNKNTVTAKTVLKAMRIHQWAKNLLIFVALILSHTWSNGDSLQASIIAFLSFSLAASSIYIINDLLDLESDRLHQTKKNRPLASGTLSIPFAILIVPILLSLSLGLATQVNIDFIIVLITYIVLTTAYSIFLKPIVLVDVITLTSLYTIRIIAGATAINAPLSDWLLAFSMFIFLSLALIKRFSELKNLIEQNKTSNISRGYHTDDLPAVSLFGICSGYISVLVLVLYTHDLQADELYKNADWLWIIAVLVLFWISRMWLLAYRGQMNEDPVLFAIKDRISYIISILTAITLFLAL